MRKEENNFYYSFKNFFSTTVTLIHLIKIIIYRKIVRINKNSIAAKALKQKTQRMQGKEERNT